MPPHQRVLWEVRRARQGRRFPSRSDFAAGRARQRLLADHNTQLDPRSGRPNSICLHSMTMGPAHRARFSSARIAKTSSIISRRGRRAELRTSPPTCRVNRDFVVAEISRDSGNIKHPIAIAAQARKIDARNGGSTTKKSITPEINASTLAIIATTIVTSAQLSHRGFALDRSWLDHRTLACTR